MVDLYRLAEQLKIDDIAVCHAGRFEEVERLLKKDIELGILPPFVEADIQKRVEPKLTMPDAGSFIVLLEHYEPTVYKKREGRYGNISPAASGEDYHRIVREKLNALTAALNDADTEGHYQAYVDNSPFSEKHVAIRAGLGKIMKNGLFYSKKFGSRCYIGIVLTNRASGFFGLSQRHDDADEYFLRCLTCQACIRSCPGQALSDHGMNSYQCVAYLTQKKEALTESEEIAMGSQIYGCDVCQKVCPLNMPILKGYETGEEVSLDMLLTMSNKQFQQTYQKTAAGWRGKKQLKKNAEIVLRNMERKHGNLEFQRS